MKYFNRKNEINYVNEFPVSATNLKQGYYIIINKQTNY